MRRSPCPMFRRWKKAEPRWFVAGGDKVRVRMPLIVIIQCIKKLESASSLQCSQTILKERKTDLKKKSETTLNVQAILKLKLKKKQ